MTVWYYLINSRNLNKQFAPPKPALHLVMMDSFDNLSPRQQRHKILGVIAHHCRKAEHRCCFASNEYLSQKYSTSERTIQRRIGELKDEGLIRCSKGKIGKKTHERIMELTHKGNEKIDDWEEAKSKRKGRPSSSRSYKGTPSQASGSKSKIFPAASATVEIEDDVQEHEDEDEDDTAPLTVTPLKGFGTRSVTHSIDKERMAEGRTPGGCPPPPGVRKSALQTADQSSQRVGSTVQGVRALELPGSSSVSDVAHSRLYVESDTPNSAPAEFSGATSPASQEASQEAIDEETTELVQQFCEVLKAHNKYGPKWESHGLSAWRPCLEAIYGTYGFSETMSLLNWLKGEESWTSESIVLNMLPTASSASDFESEWESNWKSMIRSESGRRIATETFLTPSERRAEQEREDAEKARLEAEQKAHQERMERLRETACEIIDQHNTGNADYESCIQGMIKILKLGETPNRLNNFIKSYLNGEFQPSSDDEWFCRDLEGVLQYFEYSLPLYKVVERKRGAERIRSKHLRPLMDDAESEKYLTSIEHALKSFSESQITEVIEAHLSEAFFFNDDRLDPSEIMSRSELELVLDYLQMAAKQYFAQKAA